jgi:hypothetical protein
MSWYYAGPEAKPVGPVSLEEIHARRLSGLITPETYIIEQNGQPGVTPTWRRYREIFPESAAMPPSLPPIPPALPHSAIPPAPPAMPINPLFPSAPHAPHPVYVPPTVPQAAPHGHYPARRTNACCAWGFGLGIASFILCGSGLILGLPALVICILGFAQVQQRPEQSGRGLAVAGGVLALLAILLSIVVLSYAIPAAIKEREAQAAQQNSE